MKYHAFMSTREAFYAGDFEYIPSAEELSGTIITVTQRLPDGNIDINHRIVGETYYSSNYWKSKSDGEYSYYMTQGGFRDLKLPKDEKIELCNYLLSKLDYIHDIFGFVTIDKFKGVITHIRIELK